MRDHAVFMQSNTAPKELETERTIMRPHQLSDFDDCARMWADFNVTEKITGRPSSRAESWARHLRHLGHWSALGFGYWVVTDKTNGLFLGEVGFGFFQRDMQPALGEFPEIGWVLSPAAQGRGLASETANAATCWGDENFCTLKTVCIVAPDHPASIRIAEKLGYKHFGMGDYLNQPTMMMERTKP